jgi:hypothetical protein
VPGGTPYVEKQIPLSFNGLPKIIAAKIVITKGLWVKFVFPKELALKVPPISSTGLTIFDLYPV